MATDRHGLVTRGELLRAGFSAAGIQRRVRKGILLPEYPGVYRVGHRAPSTEARYLAAVRACGGGSLLRAPAAGPLLGVLKAGPSRPEVLTPRNRRIAGIEITRTERIDPRDAPTYRGVPITTAARTLVDLAAVLELEARQLPQPTTNRPAGGRRVDCRWPDHRLTVELDSYTFHSSRHAWEETIKGPARPTPAATTSAATPGAT